MVSQWIYACTFRTGRRLPSVSQKAILVGADGRKGVVNAGRLPWPSAHQICVGIVRRLLQLEFLGTTTNADGMIVVNAVVQNLSTDVRQTRDRYHRRLIDAFTDRTQMDNI